ncbi:ParA family protein [Haloechinothrix sp. YIM 98757]|uniref:ParA family protein n=1 Tax=Haloechinothrix aidingensis TaxID=2752311 RepID=A0A837ZYW1_9PSEU|nr:ParA family protein [Haloechinothrix aidingensis]MBA0125806.1 ParA family protein [Haloechinothrix aidingensis]
MQITSVINQKGGVGKTALSVGVSAALAEQGKRTLLVDLDPQGHATTEFLGLPEAQPGQPSLPLALSKMWKGSVEELAVRHPRCSVAPGGCLDVVPTAPGMFDLVRRLDQFRVPGWQLARVIQFGNYDHVIIDCPPALDLLTNNALAATHGVLVPVQPDRTSIRALRLLYEQVNYLEQLIDRDPITYYGLVPGLYRRPMSAYADTALRELHAMGIPVLPHIPMGVVINEAAQRGIPITTFAPHCVQTSAFHQIAQILEGRRAQQTSAQGTKPAADGTEEFVFEDFISDISGTRSRRDTGARSGLYDLMPRRKSR